MSRRFLVEIIGPSRYIKIKSKRFGFNVSDRTYLKTESDLEYRLMSFLSSDAKFLPRYPSDPSHQALDRCGANIT